MRVYAEHSGNEFNAFFESLPGNATIPNSAQWKLLCVTTDKVLQDWTALTPVVESDGTNIQSCYVTVNIPGSLNVIQSYSNPREQKRLLICADKDTDREYMQERDYYVKRLGR